MSRVLCCRPAPPCHASISRSVWGRHSPPSPAGRGRASAERQPFRPATGPQERTDRNTATIGSLSFVYRQNTAVLEQKLLTVRGCSKSRYGRGGARHRGRRGSRRVLSLRLALMPLPSLLLGLPWIRSGCRTGRPEGAESPA